jgi:hypothetical protein
MDSCQLVFLQAGNTVQMMSRSISSHWPVKRHPQTAGQGKLRNEDKSKNPFLILVALANYYDAVHCSSKISSADVIGLRWRFFKGSDRRKIAA